MDFENWVEIYPKYFYGEKGYSYNNGKPSNYLGVKVIECSKEKDQVSYGRYCDGELVAIIMISDEKYILSKLLKFRYTATVRSLEGYAYDSFYSESLEELKLKSDLHLLEQGYIIKFPGI